MTSSLLARLRTRLRDATRYSGLAQAGLFTRALAPNAFDPSRQRRAARLLRAYRLTFRPFWVRRLASQLDSVRALSEDSVFQMTQRAWSWYCSKGPLDRSVLLKAPTPGGERGVLLIFPEYNWLRLFSEPTVARELTNRYTLILTAGWSPLDYALLELIARRSAPHLIYIQPCNRAEVVKIEAFHPKFKCLPTLGCDWINPDLYRPRAKNDRDVDLVMVANWGPFKRHWHLFAALRELPANLRVRLIGQPDGLHRLDRVRQQAREFGVPQQLEFFESLPVDQVQEHLGAARVSVVLSRHEGYCGAVTESMFADTPVGLLEDAFIGSKDYINDRTGVLLPHRNLGQALAEFLRRADQFQPREWAVENVSCHRSLPKVNAMLKAAALAEGQPWTSDLAAFCWRPLATLIQGSDASRLRPACEELATRWPTLFDVGLVRTFSSGS